MDHLFYFFLIFPLMWELFSFTNTKKVHNFFNKIKEKSKNDKLDENDKLFIFIHLLYFIWVFIGLFSSQWFLFLIMLLLSLPPNKSLLYRKIESFICVVVILFIILNVYHLQIDVFNIFVNVFK